jgi:8-oxo-dGTP diphosphatase
MKTYTLGFVFNQDISEVLLMHKNRPDWQVGKLNGVGGRIESNEESVDCMVREVLEETGVATKKEDWIYFGEIKSDDWRVDLYTLTYIGDIKDFSTTTDEKIEWFKVDDLPDGVLGNLRWMIPLAMDKYMDKDLKSCSVEYDN